MSILYSSQEVFICEVKKTMDIKNLTQREMEILGLLVQGKTSLEISKVLHISRHTVDTHRRRILKKVQVKNTVELISNYLLG